MHLYCVGCKSHQECSNPKKSVSANGRAMIKATCPHGHTCCSFKGMAGEGFLSDTVLPFLKPLVNKAKDAAIAAAKKKAEELAKAAAEKLVNTLADKAKEKMKGKGKSRRPEGMDPRFKWAGSGKDEREVAVALAELKLGRRLTDTERRSLMAKAVQADRTPEQIAATNARISAGVSAMHARNGQGLAPAPSQMSASQLTSIKKKMRNL